jgi:hypothetical protein
MKPDLVLGLQSPFRIPHSEELFPIPGIQVLLPFLIVEAKKADLAPGFRDIQYQTAFPIRRMLQAQAEVRRADSFDEPSFVWFFAYQGDHWRLYACIEDDQKVVSFSHHWSLWPMLIWYLENIRHVAGYDPVL